MHLNSILTYLTDSTTQKAVDLHRPHSFSVESRQIRRVLVEICCDLVEIQRDLFKICLDPVSSCYKRLFFDQIHRISAKSAQFSASSNEFRPDSTLLKPDHFPAKNRPIVSFFFFFTKNSREDLNSPKLEDITTSLYGSS